MLIWLIGRVDRSVIIHNLKKKTNKIILNKKCKHKIYILGIIGIKRMFNDNKNQIFNKYYKKKYKKKQKVN